MRARSKSISAICLLIQVCCTVWCVRLWALSSNATMKSSGFRPSSSNFKEVNLDDVPKVWIPTSWRADLKIFKLILRVATAHAELNFPTQRTEIERPRHQTLPEHLPREEIVHDAGGRGCERLLWRFMPLAKASARCWIMLPRHFGASALTGLNILAAFLEPSPKRLRRNDLLRGIGNASATRASAGRQIL